MTILPEGKLTWRRKSEDSMVSLSLSGLLVDRGEKKVKFRGIFRDKFAEKRPISREFRGSFRGQVR